MKKKENLKSSNKKKKTPLMIAATVFNWLSLGIIVVAILLGIVKLFGVSLYNWNLVGGLFLGGIALGVLWAVFAMIMINVFHKR